MPDISGFVDLCERQLRLCGVHEGEKIAVLSQSDERREYADAFMSAATRLGAIPYHVRLHGHTDSLGGDVGTWRVGATPLAGNRPALEALKQADMVIDLMFLLFSDEQHELQANGARVLLCMEPIDLLSRMFTPDGLRERVEAGGEMLGKARSLRFTNPAGTDVVYRLGAFPVITQYGYTDTPGRWDHWPSGFLFTGGADDGVDGKVVLAPGDIVFPFKSYVRDSIEFTIERGRIVDIRGGLDGTLMREYMASFDDPDAYGIAHIGWGMHEGARRSGLATDTRGIGMEARSSYGNVLFSTGPNREFGGSNETECHVDMPMHGCSLYLDDEPIVLDGDIVVDELKAPGR